MSNYRSYQSGFLDFIPVATRTLILINLAFYLAGLFEGSFIATKIAIYLPLTFVQVMEGGFAWQFLTYMFLHGSFLHILFNMLGLFFFGKELEEMWGPKRFTFFYLACGIGAGLVVFLNDLGFHLFARYFSSNPRLDEFFYPTSRTVGASGAILGLLTAYGLYWPERSILVYFIIPLRISYFIIFSAASALFFQFTGIWPGVSHLAHFGGILSAVIFFRFRIKDSYYRAGNHTLDQFFAWLKLPFKRKPKMSIYENASSYRQPEQSFFKRPALGLDETKMTDVEVEMKIDELLGTISKKGLKGLSVEEQLFLDRVSRLYRHKFP